jgi:hypothetical protein
MSLRSSLQTDVMVLRWGCAISSDSRTAGRASPVK